MKVVFDSNIFVSALALPGGSAEKAIVAVAEAKCALVISKPIIHEVLDVLARKFGRDSEDLARTAVFLAEIGTVVTPRKKIRVLTDEPDNRILECAVAGHANVIVTGDKAMLALSVFHNVEIVGLREFLSRLS